MPRLPSPTARLWLLLGGHALLLLGALSAAGLLYDSFDPEPVLLPVAALQWGLLVVAFGLGPFRLRWRVLWLLLFLAHLAIVGWAIEVFRQSQGWAIDNFWEALVDPQLMQDAWRWPDRELEIIWGLGLFVVLGLLHRWVVRIDRATEANQPLARPPRQITMRTAIVISLAGAVLVAVVRGVQANGGIAGFGNFPIRIEELVPAVVLGLIWLASLGPLAAHKWAEKTLLALIVCGVVFGMFGFMLGERPSQGMFLIPLGLALQLVFIGSLLVLRSRGWRLRWRWQAWSTPWRAKPSLSRRELWRRRAWNAGAAAAVVAVAAIPLYWLIIRPRLRQWQVVSLIEQYGGTVRKTSFDPWEATMTVRFLHKHLPEGFFSDASGVYLEGCDVPLNVVQRLRDMPQLEYLDLNDAQLTDDGLDSLRHLPLLRMVKLGGNNVTDRVLTYLADPTKLVELNLEYTLVTDAGLENLRGCNILQRLSLNGTNVTDAGLAHLAGLTQLRTLELGGTNVADQLPEYLAGCLALVELDLGDSEFADDGLKKLSNLPNLQHLFLRGTAVTDLGMAHLAKCPRLRALDLGATAISDDGVYELQRLLGLRGLSLAATRISDTSMKYIAGMRLGFVRLDDTNITDAGLAFLERHATLNTIEAAGTKVTIDGANKLRKNSPNDVHILGLPGVDIEEYD